MKFVGVTTRYLEEGNTLKQFVNDRYLEYLKKHDLVPIILPIKSKHLNTLLNLCDCFVITGGSDIDSIHYKEKLHAKAYGVNADMDLLDRNVIEHAVLYRKPLFGICRGLQAINIFLGGSMIQHLEDEIHSIGDAGHKITLLKDNFFSRILPEELHVNSFHHQVIKKIAPSLIPCGYAGNVIEAIEHINLPIIGCQWHPEKNPDEHSYKILDAFARLIK